MHPRIQNLVSYVGEDHGGLYKAPTKEERKIERIRVEGNRLGIVNRLSKDRLQWHGLNNINCDISEMSPASEYIIRL